MAIDSLRIEDFSDREFLLVLRDVADGDGWADSEHVAAYLDLRNKRLASSRLSWLRRYGAVEREVKRDHTGNIRAHRNGEIQYTQRWRLTPLGEAMALGKLRKRDEQTLGGMNEGQMLLAVRYISEQSRGESGPGKLLQREWRFGHARR
jgi:hypothetical protein